MNKATLEFTQCYLWVSWEKAWHSWRGKLSCGWCLCTLNVQSADFLKFRGKMDRIHGPGFGREGGSRKPDDLTTGTCIM